MDCFHSQQTRAPLIVCMGRNDGASGSKRRNSNRNRRKEDFSGPAADDGLWFDAEADPDGNLTSSATTTSSNSSSRSGPAAARQFQPQPSSSGWERAGSLSARQGGRQGRGRQAKGRDDEEEEEEEDVRGWWERPEERSLQAYAAPSLEPWQEERLLRAYAAGRRKAPIQDLSRELGVDRSVVIGWLKEFALKPSSEREALLSALRGSETGGREVGAAVRQREGASSSSSSSSRHQQGQGAAAAAAAAAGGGGGGGGREGEEAAPSSGFIPYYLRKQQQQQGGDKPRKLKGEVLRTLEAIYDRTPFPSADVVRGLYELHRLPRDAATEWFAARRAQDGISSSTEKRSGRVSLREKDRDLQFAGGAGRVRAAAAAAAAGGSHGVVTLSRQEMAALRSSLPSPTKHKGRQRAEEWGIKTGGWPG
ncbi:homeodomain protein, partial [Volvox carteri f. nagariensis]